MAGQGFSFESFCNWAIGIAIVGGIVLLVMFDRGMSCDSKRGFNFDTPESVAKVLIENLSEAKFDEAREYTKDIATTRVSNIEVFYASLDTQNRDVFRAQTKRFLTTAKFTSGAVDKEQNKTSVRATLGNDVLIFNLSRESYFYPWYVDSITVPQTLLGSR